MMSDVFRRTSFYSARHMAAIIGISKSTIDDSPQDAILVPHLKVMYDLANRSMFRLTPHEPSSRSFAMIRITT